VGAQSPGGRGGQVGAKVGKRGRQRWLWNGKDPPGGKCQAPRMGKNDEFSPQI